MSSDRTIMSAADPVAVEYIVNGPRTANGIIQGTTQIVGMACAGRDGEWFGTTGIRRALRSIGSRPRIYDDAIFSLMIERLYNFPTGNSFHDVRVINRLLGNPQFTSPESLALRPPWEMKAGSLGRAYWILQLYEGLTTQLHNLGLDSVYTKIELPVIDPCRQMILNGVQIDVPRLKRIQASAEIECDLRRHQINDVAGCSVNPDSSASIQDLLYNKLALPVLTYTQSHQPSTDRRVLQRLNHPIIPLLQEYRAFKSILTGASSLLSSTSSITGRVHALFEPTGADSGRFSCSGPNLQALPSLMLDGICTGPTRTFVELDIRQAELRVLAHLSQDPFLVQAYQHQDVDLHRHTAAVVLGVPEATITAEQRDTFGKVINFGIVYGETDFGLSLSLGISLSQAREMLRQFFNFYPRVASWIEEVHRELARTGYVRTLYGRLRHLPHIASQDPSEVSRAQRQGINSIVQGTAADLIKIGIVRLHQTMPANCRLILTVHDSVLLEVPEDRVAEVIPIFRASFEQPFPGFSIPLQVNVGVGKTWAQCKVNIRP